MGKDVPKDLFKGIEMVAESMKIEIPIQVRELESLPVLHDNICKKEEMRDIVLKLLQEVK